jgi:hypothetical protein
MADHERGEVLWRAASVSCLDGVKPGSEACLQLFPVGSTGRRVTECYHHRTDGHLAGSIRDIDIGQYDRADRLL